MRAVVFHSGYGCETGCCGHVVELDDGNREFEFEHMDDSESVEDFVKRLVTERFGAEHCADIDFDACHVVSYADE